MWIAPAAALVASSVSLLSSRGLPTVTGTSATLGSLKFAKLKCTAPLEHLVRVHTMGLRHLGYAGARPQRQLHNLKLL